jgi:hypothetical protein
VCAAQEADAEDLKMLEDLENTIINAGGHGETKKDGQE